MESVLCDYDRINNLKKKWLFDDNSVSDYYYEDATTISIICHEKGIQDELGKYLIDLFSARTRLYSKSKKSEANKLLYYCTSFITSNSDYFNCYRNNMRTLLSENKYDISESNYIFGVISLSNIFNHYYGSNLGIDINKVNMMIILSSLNGEVVNDKVYRKIIEEYNSQETMEAKYARMCFELEKKLGLNGENIKEIDITILNEMSKVLK